MTEDRFEQSADMRLVEHRREQLGIAKPAAPAWQTRAAVDLPFGPAAPEIEAPQSGAVLSLTLTASPDSGLIPGAIVTLGLAVINEGAKEAHKTALRLPLPSAMTYRPGSLQIDGRDCDDELAEQLMGTGLDLGTLSGSQRRTVLLKLAAKPSLDDPILMPSLSSSDAAVVGAKALRLARKTAAPQTAFAASVSRALPAEPPPYELEPEEELVYEAADAALSSSTAVPATAAAPVAAAPEAPPPDEPKTAPVAISARTRKTPAAVLTDPTLATTIEKSKLATFGQFFSPSRSFGMIAHYLLLSTLACSRTLPPETSDEKIASFFAAQDALLTKALIAKRLKKNVSLGDVGAPLPDFPPRFPESAPLPAVAEGPVVVLLRTFSTGELDFLGRAISNTASPPFTRAGQLSVGLCARTVVVADRSKGSNCERALVDYAANASSEINRLFVRARLDRRTDLFGASSPQLDAAARAVLAGLEAVL